MRFWATFILLAPLLWLQGQYARRRTPRLPAVLDNNQASATTDSAKRQLLVLGESPAVGVGVETAEQALPAQFALALSEATDQSWGWHVIGENGARLERLLELLREVRAPLTADCVVIVMGVNDTTGLTSRRRWRSQLIELVQQLRAATSAPIVFTPVPPIHCFTALPQPLRRIMGLRARQVDQDMLAVLDGLPDVHRAPVLPPLQPRDLAHDGFHPAAGACAEWGRRMAEIIRPLL